MNGRQLSIATLGALLIGVALIALYTRQTAQSPIDAPQPPIASSKPTPRRAQPLPAPRVAASPGKNGVVLADVAEQAIHGVVNISTTKIVRSPENPTPMGPFFHDPFFRFFFGPNRPPHHARKERSLGSGVVVSADGIVLTNNHVIENAEKIRVSLSDGREFSAAIVGRDPESDLAVLRLEGEVSNLHPLPFGDSSALRLGDVVLAIGNPFGVGQTVTMGIVSAKGRANVGIVEYEDFIQTDAAINPGNSGGALVNMRGELVGINTAILSRSGGYQGIGFAIPSNMAKPIMTSIVRHGTVRRGWLGVVIQDISPDLKDALDLPSLHGVLVTDVAPGSPAARAGIQRGDVILRIEGETMSSTVHLRNTVATAGPGATLNLEVWRSGKTLQLRATLRQRPSQHVTATLDAKAGALGGLTIAELTGDLRRRFQIGPQVRGVVVTQVAPRSPADRAGFQPGDVIVEVNRKPVDSVQTFTSLFARSKGVVAVLVNRQGHLFFIGFRKP